ncbi:MAG TPA: hypothetical protein VF392_11480 [Terracidiphilus sp.]|jgi:uncharacterized protein YbaR (Trm112 family)
MQTDEKNLKAVETWAGQLACPVCFGALALSAAHAACSGCGRVFPVVDGIPVLIAERAAAITPR